MILSRRYFRPTSNVFGLRILTTTAAAAAMDANITVVVDDGSGWRSFVSSNPTLIVVVVVIVLHWPREREKGFFTVTCGPLLEDSRPFLTSRDSSLNSGHPL